MESLIEVFFKLLEYIFVILMIILGFVSSEFFLIPKKLNRYFKNNGFSDYEKTLFNNLINKYKQILKNEKLKKTFFSENENFKDNIGKLINKEQITYDNFLFFLRKISNNKNIKFNEKLMKYLTKKLFYKNVFKHLLNDYQKNYKK
jgi:hypothetical protein